MFSPRLLVWTSLAVVAVICLAPARVAAASVPIPCASEPLATGWQVYANRAVGFCFIYPRTFKPARPGEVSSYEKLLGVNSVAKLREVAGDASISVELADQPFTEKNLLQFAPKGHTAPPERVREGNNEFFHYGATTGDIAFQDQYFFNYGGRILQIVFNPPYFGDSNVRQLQRAVLASFRVFGPPR